MSREGFKEYVAKPVLSGAAAGAAASAGLVNVPATVAVGGRNLPGPVVMGAAVAIGTAAGNLGDDLLQRSGLSNGMSAGVQNAIEMAAAPVLAGAAATAAYTAMAGGAAAARAGAPAVFLAGAASAYVGNMAGEAILG